MVKRLKIGQIYRVGDRGAHRYTFFIALKEGPSPREWEDFNVMYGLEYTQSQWKGKPSGKPYTGEWGGIIEVYRLDQELMGIVRKRDVIQREFIKVVFGKGGVYPKWKMPV